MFSQVLKVLINCENYVAKSFLITFEKYSDQWSECFLEVMRSTHGPAILTSNGHSSTSKQLANVNNKPVFLGHYC